jgi:hypothetical protein
VLVWVCLVWCACERLLCACVCACALVLVLLHVRAQKKITRACAGPSRVVRSSDGPLSRAGCFCF